MVRSNELYSVQQYLMLVTGKCYICRADDDIAFIEQILKENELELWNYPLDEIDHIVENELDVVLVQCYSLDDSDNMVGELRWFEVPSEEYCNAKELTSRVAAIESPYADIQTQIENGKMIGDKSVEWLEFHEILEDLDFNLFEMWPKVTYDVWMVCYYEEDGRLYYIDKDSVVVVVPTEIIEYEPNADVYTDMHKGFCCGEADDMSCFVYFEEDE